MYGISAPAIAWHNATWNDEGYGVWVLRARDMSLAAADRLPGIAGSN
jgi:hypothetical protein